MKADTIVLGAGIVGVSTAVHLQKRGRSVTLVDRKPPGNETSFGNAGLIQREGVYPYAFPRHLGALLRYARNQSIDVHYHPDAMLRLAPFLWRYWLNSHPARHAAIARQYATLIEHCVTEHRALAHEADVSSMLKPIGWIKVFRSPTTLDAGMRDAELWRREFGVNTVVLDPVRLHDVEPCLDTASLAGGLHYTDADSTSDPGALVGAYASYFERLGGRILTGDALTLDSDGTVWRVMTNDGPVIASSVVIALGPWSDRVTTKLGYRLPLAVKRGYHMHYKPQAGAALNHPVLDADTGYLLAPMTRGIRLTTGAELADRDALKTPTQLTRAEPVARTLFPLGERVDSEPWMGMRPCTPDMMPVIGPAPRHRNMWFAFGHAHHGLTLGPVTGRLIAEMITGEAPLLDPAPFRADRF